MAIFKCKMCGGKVEFEEGATVGVCDSCGTKQTLPRLDDDRKANLYDRANHFRRNDEFDKAAGIYEQILNEDSTDAEAYWSLVLCRYGIEYVEDPASHKRVPTVNRAQFTSIFDDDNYKSALHHADTFQRAIYEEEAKAINEIQKGILEISQKEEPFDVFICYKETDSSGKRTPDSVLANELYHQLTQEGFKVFFARITLEEKLGSAYEPYIFAALNSAKVMVVLGTKPEFFQAAWVKNEWSRYLALIKNGAEKLLIPAYKDMDPYDLPEEFSHLQAQDMSKLGFMQDLIRGINKIIKADEPPAARENAAASGGSSNIAPLLKRAFMFLEDGDWAKADEFCEQVLNQDPENAEAYLGKLMAEIQVKNKSALKDCKTPFDGNNNYQKALRFGGEKLAAELKGYIVHINERNEEERLLGIYEKGVAMMNTAYSEEDCKMAAHTFQKIGGFKDADTLAEQCLEKAEVFRKDTIYEAAKTKMKGIVISHYESAIKLLESIPGWKDAEEQISLCQKKIEELRAEEEAKRLESERRTEEARIAAEKVRKKVKRIAAIIVPILCVCIAFVILLITVIIPKQKLNEAINLVKSGNYESGYAQMEELGRSDMIVSNKYDRAATLMDSGDYEAAYALLKELGDNKAIASNKYDRAVAFMDSGDYESAYLLLEGLDYKDSADKRTNLKPQYERFVLSKAAVGDEIIFGAYEQDNNTSNGKEDIKWKVLEREGDKILIISKYEIDCQPYHNVALDITWENCFLREWLNGSFFKEAFTSNEQLLIESATVAADQNPRGSADSGNDTTDKIFLLSIAEADKYFKSNNARVCLLTDYAAAQGATSSGEGAGWWFLRSPGSRQFAAAYVGMSGEIGGGGTKATERGAIRPALWVSLK